MPSLLRAVKRLSLVGLISGLPLLASAQTVFPASGGEYAIVGALPGDQNYPQIKINRSGGFLVWQDNRTDGDGLGISAQRLDSNLSASLGSFRINHDGAGDQENPQLSLLQDGGAVFVWQGGTLGFQKVYARFLKPAGTFATPDIAISAYAATNNNNQVNPVVATLTDGSVVVAWQSFGQDGDMLGVFAQRFTAAGANIGTEFQVNQTTANNQRTPAITALPSGGFAIVWVSELQRFDKSVDIYGRLYGASGAVASDEILINSGTNVCANPGIDLTPDGGFLVVWSENVGVYPTANGAQGWDVVGRPFNSNGTAKAPQATRINAFTDGDQYGPRICASGSDHLVVWTSVGQDGSREGVYGRFISDNGAPEGVEFLVNTTTISQQLQPTVGSDGNGRFLAVWSGFVAGTSFDLFAQRYNATQTLLPPDAPYVSASDYDSLGVAWPILEGYSVDHYELYLDNNATPIVVTNNFCTITDLAASSAHSVKLAFVLANGQRSPLSVASSATTWGKDANHDGLPDDWQAKFWGPNPANWPAANADSDGDGVTNLQEFLAGTDPTDPSSALRLRFTVSDQGRRVEWNTQPGFVYQAQISTDTRTWNNFGQPRFAAGAVDSISAEAAASVSFYRILRVR